MTEHDERKPALGQWCMTRREPCELVGQLAAGAAVDRRFLRNGHLEIVRQHLSAMQAEGGVFAPVDDTNCDWIVRVSVHSLQGEGDWNCRSFGSRQRSSLTPWLARLALFPLVAEAGRKPTRR